MVDNRERGAYFGSSVTVTDTHIIVGARYAVINGVKNGAVYIFDLHGVLLHKLTSDSPAVDDRFGTGVAANSTRILVAANNDDTYGVRSGCAFLFDYNGNQIAKFASNDIQAGDQFGVEIAMNETHIVIGACDEDTGGSSAGAAYIFDINGNQLHKIQASDKQAGDYFGGSINMNDTQVVVGSDSQSSVAQYGGAAYVYDLTGTQLFKIQPATQNTSDNLGWSVAMSNTRIVVTAIGIDSTLTDIGAAYIYDTTGTLITTLQPSDLTEYSYFGAEVSISDKYIVIGSPDNTNNYDYAGAIYIFDLDGNLLQKVYPDTLIYGSEYGAKVCIGANNMLVSTFGGTSVSNGATSVFLYDIKNYTTSITLPVGISTIGNSTTDTKPIASLGTGIDSVKTLINDRWGSWTKDTPDTFQQTLNIEPGMGYIVYANAVTTLELNGDDIDYNAIPMVKGTSMITVPSTLDISNGKIPRTDMSNIKTFVNGQWVSWDKTSPSNLQGFTTITPNVGYVCKLDSVYDNTSPELDTVDGVGVNVRDNTIISGDATKGVSLTAPGLPHKLGFDTITYDGSLPANYTFYKIGNVIGKIDYPSELEGSVYTISDGKNTYSGVYDGTATYLAPTQPVMVSDTYLTKTTKPVSATPTLVTMNLSVDGDVSIIKIASEYIGDTFQVWKNGDMREAVFAAGNVTVTFV